MNLKENLNNLNIGIWYKTDIHIILVHWYPD
jgi:hypothetical protein